MTDETATQAQLEALAKLDTPTVCNAIELVEDGRRAFGFTTKMLQPVRPELGVMVGVARTVTVRASRPSTMDAEAMRDVRFGYLDYVESATLPAICVAQDIDDGDAGFGCFFGEVNSAIHMALGCPGLVTNGAIRDLDDLAPGFQALAGSVTPSHGFIHVVDFGGTVEILGMTVNSGDLVHADKHGATVLPRGKVDEVLEAAGLMARREAVVLKAAQTPGVDAAAIKQAWLDMAKVT
ncbi:MAG: RraA family protein [Alphaproteobacteria bacterium]|jgi:regulator of RNase E activity RraA|nr:RraA family protein [Alphaproteobacteria bacterium]